MRIGDDDEGAGGGLKLDLVAIEQQEAKDRGGQDDSLALPPIGAEPPRLPTLQSKQERDGGAQPRWLKGFTLLMTAASLPSDDEMFGEGDDLW